MLERLLKERATILSLIAVLVLTTLWIFQKPTEHGEVDSEMSLTIPQGHVILPIELSNAQQLAPLIIRLGIVDVFSPRAHSPLVKNLRIIKLEAGAGPLFGALVPENKAGLLQDVFSRQGLKGAIRPPSAGSTEIRVPKNTQPLTLEVSIENEE